MPVDTTSLARTIVGVADAMEHSAPELRALDAAIGDGDLGVTFTLGARAIRRVVVELEQVEPATLLVACGRAFANANPSTMGALLGAGLNAAGVAVRGRIQLDAADFEAMGSAACNAIQTLGRAELGQKTVLDALRPSIEALAATTGRGSLEVVAAMRAAAEEGAASMDAKKSQIGRASWLGERSRGRRDPGAQSWVLMLAAVEAMLGTPDSAMAEMTSAERKDEA